MNRIDVAQFPIKKEELKGYSTKYWIDDNKPKLVKYNEPTCKDGDIMESLSSEILKNVGVAAVNVTLGYNSNDQMLKSLNLDDSHCALIDSFLNDDEVSCNINTNIPKVKTPDVQKNISSAFYKTFNLLNNLPDITNEDKEKLKTDYIRLVYGDIIINNEDRHLKNVEIIYNPKNNSYKLAPSFDNAQGFNAYSIGAEDGYAYVGNQDFPNEEIITYIVNHYYDETHDIMENLDYLMTNEIGNILGKYTDDLEPEKMKFIYTYMDNINQLTKMTLEQKNTKTRN